MNTHRSDAELLALIDSGTQDEHVSGCAGCRHRHQEFEATLTWTRRVPEAPWTPLQDERLLQGARRRLRERRVPRRPVWQPALGGALLTGAAAAILFLVLLPTQRSTTSVHEALAGEYPIEVAEADDAELAMLIETYLIETASADELLLELDKLAGDE
ncbi:MAG: hypothetical protein O2782_03500 [bacterium]|nr:hypothetical protein [bacterium]